MSSSISMHRKLRQGVIVVSLLGILIVSLVALQGVSLVALLASATSSLSIAPAVLYFTPYDSRTLPVGSDTTIDININAHVPINALGITVKFPTDLIEVVAFSKQKSFLTLWTEDTSINETTGEIHFSGGTTRSGGLTGTSTALTITIEAKSAGQATLSFEDAEVYASDGTGTSVTNKTRSITFSIPAPAPAQSVTIGAPVASGMPALSNTLSAPTAPSPDFNNDGKINLVDMSILLLHMIGSYDPHFDLNMDGSVNISDLSILLSNMSGKKISASASRW